MEEGRIATTAAALERHFGGEARQRIALECGTHSPWVSRLLQGMGHEVWVANARKLRAITASESKNDRNDAEKLARLPEEYAHGSLYLRRSKAQGLKPAIETADGGTTKVVP